ncbi:MAG: four helix bundle protein [Chlamydiae bacterium]|nr:four helix bundle protein [Chlamydiota bacterium]
MQELSKRTQDFALRIVKLFSALPKTTEAQVIGKQMLRSGTSLVRITYKSRLKKYSFKILLLGSFSCTLKS